MSKTVSHSGLDEDELQQVIAANESIFRKLDGASLLISGATGWFGVWLIDVLCAADDVLGLRLSITAISREPSSFLRKFPDFADNQKIRWIKADVRNLEIHGHFSHIIHAATDTSAQSSPDGSLQLFETIVGGTARIIAAAECSVPKHVDVKFGSRVWAGPTGPVAVQGRRYRWARSILGAKCLR